MRQTDFSIGEVKQTIARKRKWLRRAMVFEMDVQLLYHVHCRLRERKKDLERIRVRKRHVNGHTFNLNVFSENQSMTDFRFPKRNAHFKVTRKSGLNQEKIKFKIKFILFDVLCSSEHDCKNRL